MIAVTRSAIDTAALDKSAGHPECGAQLSFSGTVRNHHLGRPVVKLAYEAYESMAGEEMEAIAAACREQWPEVRKIQVVHRFGEMDVGQSSIYITVAAPHRVEGFAALRFLIDRIKRDVPIWKKEFLRRWGVGLAPSGRRLLRPPPPRLVRSADAFHRREPAPDLPPSGRFANRCPTWPDPRIRSGRSRPCSPCPRRSTAHYRRSELSPSPPQDLAGPGRAALLPLHDAETRRVPFSALAPDGVGSHPNPAWLGSG